MLLRALLGDGEGSHLEGGVGENLSHSLFAAVEINGLGDGAEDGLVNSAVSLQSDDNGVTVMGVFTLLGALNSNDTGAENALIYKALCSACLKCLEDIACTEVNPFGICLGSSNKSLAVELGELIACGFPCGSVKQTLCT